MSLVQYNISFIGTSADPNSREDGFFEEVGIPRSLWWDKKTMLMYKTLLFVIFWMVSLIYIYIYTVVVYPGISTKSSDTNITFVLREESTWFQTWLGQKKLSNDVCFTSGNATIKCHDFSLMYDHPHAQMPNSRLAARQHLGVSNTLEDPMAFPIPFPLGHYFQGWKLKWSLLPVPWDGSQAKDDQVARYIRQVLLAVNYCALMGKFKDVSNVRRYRVQHVFRR